MITTEQNHLSFRVTSAVSNEGAEANDFILDEKQTSSANVTLDDLSKHTIVILINSANSTILN